MRKVLIIASDLSVKGGVSSAIKSLMLEMEKRKDVHVEFYSSYINTIHPILRVFYSLMRIINFIVKLHPFKYDLFYLHVCADGSFYRKAIYVILLNILRKPVVIHQHASSLEAFLNKSRFNRWLGKLVYKSSSQIFVLSENMRRITEAINDDKDIFIIENPVHIPNFERDVLHTTSKVKLLFLGEIGKRKGIYDLVQAVAEMTDEQREKIVVDIGGNKEIDKLTSMIKEYGLEKTCIVHGWVDGEKKVKLLKEATVFILPSYFEGLPIAILEAMSYELPVISTNIAGIPEIVLHKNNGYIINPGDIEGIKQSILYFVENNELINQYGKNSRLLVEKHDVTLVVDKILNQFENLFPNTKMEKNVDVTKMQ